MNLDVRRMPAIRRLGDDPDSIGSLEAILVIQQTRNSVSLGGVINNEKQRLEEINEVEGLRRHFERFAGQIGNIQFDDQRREIEGRED